MRSTEKSYDDRNIALSAYAKSLGHPARIAIIRTLIRIGEPVRGEVIEVPPLAPGTVIQHLRELKKAGLIEGRLFGPNSCYSVNWENLKALIDNLDDFLAFVKENSSETDPE